MNRGACRRDIFSNRRDRLLFMKLIGEAVDRFSVEVHAYALMGNHYHLLVRTPEEGLDRFVHHFASNYVRSFHHRHGGDGPMFKSRYTSTVVDSDEYLSTVSRYVHRNPKDLGVTDLAGYRWSSYGAFCGLHRPPPWLTIAPTLDHCGGIARYRELVESLDRTDIDKMLDRPIPPRAIGTTSFLEAHELTHLT